MEKEVIVKRILQVVSLLLIVVIAVLLIMDHQDNKKVESQLEDNYAEFMPFQARKQELEQQLKLVEKEYQAKINGKGTLTLLCMDMTEDIYTVIYPQMKEYGYIAMLAVSETAMPGEEGCMEIAQVRELLDAGWCLCLHRKEESDPEEWLTEMQQRLEALGLEMPEQIYFERGTYRNEYDEVLTEHGLTAVVHHQETGLQALTTQTEDGIWHIGAWGWNQENARESMEQATQMGAGLVFTIGSKYYYDGDQFPKMLSVIAGYEEKESLYVTDVASAHDCRREAKGTRDAFLQELEAEREKLRAEITAVDKKLQEIYEGDAQN